MNDTVFVCKLREVGIGSQKRVDMGKESEKKYVCVCERERERWVYTG